TSVQERTRLSIKASLFLAAAACCATSAFANMICICVDCPAGSSIGIPVGIGHAFVQMMPMSGPQNGQTLSRGFYPSITSPYASGIVKDDATHGKDFCICYNVTNAQYNAAAAAINAKQANPGTYNVL